MIFFFLILFTDLFVLFIFDVDAEVVLHLCAMPHTHTHIRIHIHQMQIMSAISFQHRIKSHMLTNGLFSLPLCGMSSKSRVCFDVCVCVFFATLLSSGAILI